MKNILKLGTLAAVAAVLGSAPSYAVIRVVATVVAEVSPADDTALGGFAGHRIYTDCDDEINKNQAICTNIRCIKAYLTTATLNPGGYRSTSENMSLYCGGADDLNFWTIWDAEANAGLSNHQGYYAAASVLATGSGTGDDRQVGCPGTQATNCFGRADLSNSLAVPIVNAYQGFGAAHTVRSIGGLSPNPLPKATVTGQPAGSVLVTWDDPQTYSAIMLGPASNVTGIRLFRFDDTSFNNTCEEPNGSSPGWTGIGDFPMGSGTTGTVVSLNPAGKDCVFFATAVTFRGPGTAPAGPLLSGGTVINTQGFVGGHSQPVSTNPNRTRIVRMGAKYSGQGNVNIGWESGVEGGLTGYYVQRGGTAEGPFSRVSDLIATRGDNSSYTFTDKVSNKTRVTYYRIEMVDADGTSTFSGSSAVTVPTRNKKGSVKGIDQ